MFSTERWQVDVPISTTNFEAKCIAHFKVFLEREKILGTKLFFQLKGGKLMFLLVPLISKQSASLTNG